MRIADPIYDVPPNVMRFRRYLGGLYPMDVEEAVVAVLHAKAREEAERRPAIKARDQLIESLYQVIAAKNQVLEGKTLAIEVQAMLLREKDRLIEDLKRQLSG